MKALVTVLLLLTACATVRDHQAALLTPSPATPSERRHPDMSQAYRLGVSCDGTYVPILQIISWVGRPASGRVAATVRVIAIGAPRWNTLDGHRPTQAESNAMVDERDDMPRIFRPITLSINRVLAGSSPAGHIVAFAEGGIIGGDEMNSCGFGSPTRLQIRESSLVVTIGASYLAILGDEMLTGRATGPLDQPVINDLYLIQGTKVVGLNGTLEPLPR